MIIDLFGSKAKQCDPANHINFILLDGIWAQEKQLFFPTLINDKMTTFGQVDLSLLI